jgi:hypothetical protein
MANAGSRSRIGSLKAPQVRRAKGSPGAKMGKALRRARKHSVGLSYTWGPKIFFLASCFTGK